MNARTRGNGIVLLAAVLSPSIFSYIASYFYGVIFVEYLGSASSFFFIGAAAAFSSSVLIHVPIGYFFRGNFLLAWVIYLFLFSLTATFGMLFSEDRFLNIVMFWGSTNTWLFLMFGLFFVWVGNMMRVKRERNRVNGVRVD